MEIIEFLEQMNIFLEQSFIFRTVKFLLAFYMIIMVLAIIGIIFRLWRHYWVVLVTGQEFPKVSKGQFQKRWDKLEERIQSDNPNNWKAAILESAQMLDEVLKIIQYPGENLGERLSGMLPSQLDNLEQVKEANKIKNRIIQDDSYEITKEEAQKIVEIFGNSLRFFEAVY